MWPLRALGDAQLFNAKFQGGVGQIEPLGCAVRAGYPAMGRPQRGFDGLAFMGIELPVKLLRGLGSNKRTRFKVQPAIL